METKLYLLEWQGTEPKPDEVRQWLINQGFVITERPKVYANGTLVVECEPDPSDLWQTYHPPSEPPLASYVRTVIEARAELLAIPDHDRNATQRALLAVIELVMIGYGVSPNG